MEIIPSKTAPDNFDYSPIYRLPELQYLCVFTEYRDLHKPSFTTIDYSKIKSLKEVHISGKGHMNYNQLNSVERMDISYSEIVDLNEMECHASLKRLDVLKTGLQSLKGIGRFQQLQWLNLSYERKISDVSEIVEISDTLRAFFIQNCPNIIDFSFLEELVNLEHLALWGINKLPDLNFLFKMPKLKTFTFSMEIESGDLTPCLSVPYVWCKKGKKYYNLKDKDLPKNDSIGGFELL